MAVRPAIKIRHSYVSTYPLTAQRNWVGAQATAGKRGWWNDLSDTTATCRAMYLSGSRYLYYAAGAVLKKRDILLATSTTIATVSGGGATIDAIFVDDSYVYIGGDFTTVTISAVGTARDNAARINKTTLAIDSTWNPDTNGRVHWITGDSSGSGTAIYMGGAFTDVNAGTTRNRAAAFNASGVATSWNPNLNAASYAGARIASGTDGLAESIVIGGAFSTVGGTARNSIAEVSTTGAGTLSSWNPSVTGGTPEVLAIAVDDDNSMIYFGGEFTTVGATTRNNAAAMNYGGSLALWNPNLSTTAGHQVNAIALITDHVYLGGNFSTVGGTARVDIAKISKAGAGTLQPFHPPLTGGSSGVMALATFDRTVYVGADNTAVSACYPVLQGGSYGAYVNSFPDPLFTDTNAFFVTKAGSDTNAGTFAAPFLTIEKGRASLTGAFVYVVVADSGTYSEVLTWSNASTGLYALDGYAPKIEPFIGATPGTYGARASGRTQFSTGAAGTFCYVSKAGNDSTGTRGNSLLPFLTIAAAITAASSGDTIQLQDSGTYTEDVDGGAKALTIQAKAGEVPTLVNVGLTSADEHFKINAGLAFNLYGLNIREIKASGGRVFNANTNWGIYDCTISNGAATGGYNSTGTNRDSFLVNCLIANHNVAFIEAAQGDLTVTNCFFTRCVNPMGPGPTVDAVISRCTFFQCLQDGLTLSTSDTVDIGFTLIEGSLHLGVNDGTAVALSVPTGSVHDCILRNCDGAGINWAGPGAASKQIYNCLFEDNGADHAAITGIPFVADIRIANGTGYVVSNCTSINAAKNGYTQYSPGATTGVTLSNFTVVNAGTYGIYVDAADDALTLSAIAGEGAGTNDFYSSPARTATYSVIASIGGAAAMTNSFLESPQFLSRAVDGVDTSINAKSPCVLAGNSSASANVGNQAAVLTISGSGVAVDGFSFGGEKNLYMGIKESTDTLDSDIRYCSFADLNFAGVFKLSAGEVSNCLLENNGIGIQVANANDEIKKNVFNGCSSAGILNAAYTEAIKNNTSFSCPYGQIDRSGFSAQVQKNNVYSSSGVFDYEGVGVQDNSDVETLGQDASVDADSTRLNPLFRDESDGDFRLKTSEAGYARDSPAKSIGDDGFDAGAFAFDYGAISTSYTEIDFGTAGYYNPVDIPRKVIPVNLAEGDRDDGKLRSKANAYKTEHHLEWGEDAMMSQAQLAALSTFFQADDEEAKLSIDGGTVWIDVALVKSEGFEYDDITKTWSQDDQQTPLLALVLREQ